MPVYQTSTDCKVGNSFSCKTTYPRTLPLPEGGCFDETPYEVLNWPPQSPDLNPIEKIWAIMKDKIFERADEIDSIDTLKMILEPVFFHDEIVFLAIRNCYEPLPARIKRILESKGGHSGY